ncbi:YqzE family protein [Polycladomyces subterraneus]|uniref:YqzE family protein n=1 Tax=Polycladomyces subterraneus TaxID=1016997 RepID=A0ABT8IQ26_9BACL|nr:YqzE family protein [Polycladomyces subterraneus]MDN4594888.1 YqzE family protein [Polycladomyces subterraneus]
MSSKDLVRMMLERMIWYVETPRQERKQLQKKKEPWTVRWFGMLPISLSMMMNKGKERIRRS